MPRFFYFQPLVKVRYRTRARRSQTGKKRNYLGPVRKANLETQTVSRKLYRVNTAGTDDLLEDPTEQFNSGRFLAEEDEFDENGRLVADASSDREIENEPFRSVYDYDSKGQISEEIHYNREGSPAGKNRYAYDSSGNKVEELFYNAKGSLSSRVRYDEHQNTTEFESLGPDGSMVRKHAVIHTYKREGNTLEDAYRYEPPLPTSGGLIIVAAPKSDQPPQSPPSGAAQLKTIYTYDDSGRLIKKVSEGSEENFDSSGTLSSADYVGTRVVYSYDENGRLAEMRASESMGLHPSLTGGHARSIYKYDSYGNQKEEVAYIADGSVSMHSVYSYEYDSYGNWTKKTENEKVFNFKGNGEQTVLKIVTVHNRVISYY